MKDSMFTIKLPKPVGYILKKLREAGHEAYIVGGCVRDSIIGRKPEDWDITTSALPEEIKSVFRKTVDTGIQHGTVTVILRDEIEDKNSELRGYEVTTYRIDGEYRDGRHPEEVIFTPSLEEDLKRRDFTINAMAYNEENGIVDLFGGIEDLENGIIRCVGDPCERFTEDALRMLRAVRFAAQLDFEIDTPTGAAVKKLAKNLSYVSKERVYAEINKLICSAHPERIAAVFDLGLSEQICDEFKKINPLYVALIREHFQENVKNEVYQPDFVFKQDVSAFDLTNPTDVSNRAVRYAFLCQGMEEESVKELLKELKSDNDTIRLASLLVSECGVCIPLDGYGMKKEMQKMNAKEFDILLELKKICNSLPIYKDSCAVEDNTRLRELFKKIIDREEPVYIRDLAVGGRELIRAGVKAGPELGDILDRMLEDVLREPVHNSVLYLLSKYVLK
ncbi:MAG: polynucleotide adenylyltransferase [Eubacteriales bacterium]|nr:polynucleotide adenylyltransferase [Eubacteriales bacterium]